MAWSLLHVLRGSPWLKTRGFPCNTTRPRNTPVSSFTTPPPEWWWNHLKAQSWTFVFEMVWSKASLLPRSRWWNRYLRDLYCARADLRTSSLTSLERQKPTLVWGGKRVAEDGGQVGSCGSLKLQTTAYLQITEPRGWKRNPLCVIVSHVLPPPVIFSRLKQGPSPYSTDRLHFTGETRRTTKWELLFPAYMR